MARTAASATEFELGLPRTDDDQLLEHPVGRDLERADRLHGGDPHLFGRLGILGEAFELAPVPPIAASRPPARSPAGASRDWPEPARWPEDLRPCREPGSTRPPAAAPAARRAPAGAPGRRSSSPCRPPAPPSPARSSAPGCRRRPVAARALAGRARCARAAARPRADGSATPAPDSC